jgi:hypothetical protein
MHGIGRRFAAFFADYDILLSPVLSQPPEPLCAIDMMSDDAEVFVRLEGSPPGERVSAPVTQLSQRTQNVKHSNRSPMSVRASRGGAGGPLVAPGAAAW